MDTFDVLPYDPQNVPKTDEEKKINLPKTKRVAKKYTHQHTKHTLFLINIVKLATHIESYYVCVRLRALGFHSVLMIDSKPTLDRDILRATLNIKWVDFISNKVRFYSRHLVISFLC
jgi:hypothetical protein